MTTNGARSEAEVEKQARGPLLSELGAAGVRYSGGLLQEEFLTELQGTRGQRVYEEMRLNDPIIAGILFALEMPIREVRWEFSPGGDSAGNREASEFMAGVLEDMSVSWSDVIAQILTMFPFGYSLFERVYKRRRGRMADPSSRFDDGRTGLRKLAFRAQDSIDRWEFDDHGGLRGAHQRAYPKLQDVFLPIERLVLFRTRNEKGSPEGRSLLRTAYRPWYFKKNLEQLEAIALERTGAGFPVVYMPSGASVGTGATDETKAKDLVRRIRLDEQFGITLPGPKGGPGQDGWLFELVSSPSGRGVASGFHEAILRYRQEMLISVLATFISLGTEGVGSYALSRDQRSFFQLAVEGFARSIGDTFNRFVTPEIMQLNNFRITDIPALQHTDVGQVNLGTLGAFVGALGGLGFLTPTRELEEWLRRAAGMPDLPEDESAVKADMEVVKEAGAFKATLDRAIRDPQARGEAEAILGRLTRAMETRQRILDGPRLG